MQAGTRVSSTIQGHYALNETQGRDLTGDDVVRKTTAPDVGTLWTTIPTVTRTSPAFLVIPGTSR